MTNRTVDVQSAITIMGYTTFSLLCQKFSYWRDIWQNTNTSNSKWLIIQTIKKKNCLYKKVFATRHIIWPIHLKGTVTQLNAGFFFLVCVCVWIIPLLQQEEEMGFKPYCSLVLPIKCWEFKRIPKSMRWDLWEAMQKWIEK